MPSVDINADSGLDDGVAGCAHDSGASAQEDSDADEAGGEVSGAPQGMEAIAAPSIRRAPRPCGRAFGSTPSCPKASLT